MAAYVAPCGLIVVGLCVLLGGGELLVRGASGLAAAFRVSPLVIGLTVVAFGTSAPELAVVLQSSFAGQTDLAIGNVVGSCIFNVLFVLGLTAIVCPLVVCARLVRFEVPLMIAASVALLVLGLDKKLGRIDGLLLVAALVGYMSWTVVQSRKESREFQEEYEEAIQARAGAAPKTAVRKVITQFVFVVIGLALLTLGSRSLVNGSVEIAGLWGVSELMIGLTILAVGTSLPEIVTSILATVRDQGDIAVGNIVGSNILNILAVLGLSSLVAPAGIAVSLEALTHDIPVMIAVSVACLPIFFTDWRIDRWEGCLFFGYYVLYTTYLILAATHPEMVRTFAVIMFVFVIPLTTLTLVISVVRELPGRIRRLPLLRWLSGNREAPPCPDGKEEPSAEESSEAGRAREEDSPEAGE